MTAEHTFLPQITALEAIRTRQQQVVSGASPADRQRSQQTAVLQMQQDARYTTHRDADAPEAVLIPRLEDESRTHVTDVWIATLTALIAAFRLVNDTSDQAQQSHRVHVSLPDGRGCCNSSLAFPIAEVLVRQINAIDTRRCSAQIRISSTLEDQVHGSPGTSHWVIELTFPAQRNV